MIALALAVSLSFAWDPVTNATTYALYLNNSNYYTGSNTFCTVQVEPLVSYRAEATAINSAGESDRSEPLFVSMRPVTIYLEHSALSTGPWQVAQTNTAYMVESNLTIFYRARMAVP